MPRYSYTLAIEIEAPSREEAEKLLFELPTPFEDIPYVNVGEYDEDWGEDDWD